MSLIASDKGGDFELTPEDTYTARCYRIIGLGTQESNNPAYKPAFKVMISWEFIGVEDPRMKEGKNKGKPFSMHQKYNLNLGEKATLRAHLEGWHGKRFTKEELKGFDLTNVLNTFCTIQVVHDETGKYANINSIMSYKGIKPLPVNADVLFDIDRPDMDVFNSLSDSLKGTIMQAPEWVGEKAKPSEPVKQDVVVEDISDKPLTEDDLGGEEVNIDDIPF